MAKTEFSTPEDEILAQQLCEDMESQWKEWQMELLVLANKHSWEALKELVKRGPSQSPKLAKTQKM